MDKKVEFCVTPRNHSGLKFKNNSSTPFTKFRSPFPDFKFDDSHPAPNQNNTYLTVGNFTSNLTNVSTRDRSLYPQQKEIADRLAIEFEYLSLKFLNQKCDNLTKESDKEMENKIKKSILLLRKKQNIVVRLSKEFEMKNLLLKLVSQFDFILNYLDNEFPSTKLSKLDSQLVRYRKILIPYLDHLKVKGIRNGGCINDFSTILNEDLCVMIDKDNEIRKKAEGINEERSRRNREIIRIRSLYEEYKRIYDLMKCLSKKKV